MIRKPRTRHRSAAYWPSENRRMIRRTLTHAAPLLRHPMRFMWEALKGFKANQGLLLAGAVAYYALLSIVPLLIVSVIALSRSIELSSRSTISGSPVSRSGSVTLWMSPSKPRRKAYGVHHMNVKAPFAAEQDQDAGFRGD
mgnify:CR=1 FL=1